MQKAVAERNYYFFLTIIGIIIYCFVWISISLLRYYSLNADVYDLGISIQRIWNLTEYNLGMKSYLYIFFTDATVYLFIPVGIIGSEQLLLIIQTVCLSLPSLVIFLISKQLKVKGTISCLISLSYLIYFPLAGINLFDFHFQAFFILFFLLGYYFFLRSKLTVSALFFFLAGSSHFPFFIFILLFAIVEIGYRIFFYKAGNFKVTYNFSQRETSYFVLLALLSILMLLSAEFMGNSALNATLHIQQSTYFNVNTVFQALLVFGIMLLPFLFIQISSKWAIFLLPSFGLILIAHNINYYVPGIFLDQYTSAIIPFIFLGYIDVFNPSKNKLIKRSLFRFTKINLNSDKGSKIFAYFIFIMIVVLGLIYLPFGPLSSYSGENVQISQIIEYNSTQFDTLSEFLNLIPENATLLVQDNLPQAYPRNGPFNGSVIVPGVLGPTINLSDARLDIFPFLGGGTVKIDFALADLNSIGYFTSPVSGLYGYSDPSAAGIPSMYNLIHIMIQSGSYGTYAEANGFLLLERGYTGQPKILVKSSYYLYGKDFYLGGGASTVYFGKSILINNFTGGYAWYGPYIYLPPGSYKATFILNLTPGSFIRNITLDSISGSATFASRTYSNISSDQHFRLYCFSIEITLPNVYANLEFRGKNVSEQGTIYFEGVDLTMLS